MASDVLLIGVDGGATAAKARAAACDSLEHPTAFGLRPEAAVRTYDRVPGFTPVPVPEQIAQRDAGAIEISPLEAEQARFYVQGAADAIIDIARQCEARRILVGVGMPGLKTPDGRGINVINNGPRIPNYLSDLETELAGAGLELVQPIAALGSDADYCGLGEEWASDGFFRDVRDAYYVGCGTGVADAMKLRGELVPFDKAKPWIMKAWQFPCSLGPTFEKLISMSAVNRVYADLGVASAEFPEQDALAGRPIALAWLATAALVLAELIFERVWTIKNGRAESAVRGEAYAKLDPNHPYRGTLLDRVIVGQRLGLIYADHKFREIFSNRLDAFLTSLIADRGDPEMRQACLSRDGTRLRDGFLRGSRLRAAPALGAAVAAVQSLPRGAQS